jgi:methionine biosynthesis protein MetW
MNSEKPAESRLDHRIITGWVSEGASVLELGCGGGELLQMLSRQKHAAVSGIEIDENYIFSCVARGLSVAHQDIDDGLSEYADRAFDFVIINQCLQELRKPHVALSEAVRVGHKVIVGFPNFAHYNARIQLALLGRAPVTPALPYQWYDTPNLHFLSIRDFMLYCGKNRLSMERRAFLHKRGSVRFWPNLLAGSALFQISRDGPALIQ